jgi:hypothetical protein
MKIGVKFNINDSIRFKFTKTGWDYVNKLNATHYIYSKYPLKYKKDEWNEEQLWSFMQKFGNKFSMGFECIIETEIEFILPE